MDCDSQYDQVEDLIGHNHQPLALVVGHAHHFSMPEADKPSAIQNDVRNKDQSNCPPGKSSRNEQVRYDSHYECINETMSQQRAPALRLVLCHPFRLQQIIAYQMS